MLREYLNTQYTQLKTILFMFVFCFSKFIISLACPSTQNIKHSHCLWTRVNKHTLARQYGGEHLPGVLCHNICE